MHLIGAKYIFIKEIQAVLDRIVFVHNGAFLNCKDETEEKKESLNSLENIVRMLGTTLEKYKIYEITTAEMDITYNLCKERYKKVIIEYPWLSKFDFNDGWAISRYKFFKKMK